MKLVSAAGVAETIFGETNNIERASNARNENAMRMSFIEFVNR